MRRPVGLALVLTLTLTTAVAAELHIEKPLVNLGDIKGGVPLQHRLELTNNGDQAIEIVDVKASCGCLAPRFDQRSLAPGGKTTLVLHLRPLGQPNGSHAWNGLVRYRQREKVFETPFTVRATIHNEVTIQPTVLALIVEGSVRQEVTVTDLRRPPFKVTQAQAMAAGLEVEIQSMGDGITKILLQADGKKLGLGRQETVLDIYTDDPVYNHFQVPVTLIKSIAAKVTAVPATVALPADQKESTALVRLRSRVAFAVAKVEPSNPALACTWATNDEGETVVRVRCRVEQLSSASGPYWVRVILREPAGEVVTIPVVLRTP